MKPRTLLLLATLLMGCPGQGPDSEAPDPTRVVQGAPGPLPRVELVEVPGGKGYLRQQGATSPFVPRGNNYVRLVDDPTYKVSPYHSTFSPGRYDAAAAESALKQMETHGYNVVRVFIDSGDWDRENGINGLWAAKGLDGAYLDAFADFVRRATAHRVYVLPILERFPINWHYQSMTKPAVPNLKGWNALYMHAGHRVAKIAYVKDFIAALRARVGNAMLTTIIAYELENEMHANGDTPPFCCASTPPFACANNPSFACTGVVVQTADGLSYDMSDPAQRQQAWDANAVSYANALTAAIQSADPGALVTLGMFTPLAVGRAGPTGLLPIPGGGQEPRFPPRPASLSKYSNLSFLDIHIYSPNSGWTLDQDLASIEWDSVDKRRPVWVGEFGAFKTRYPVLTDAAWAMRDLQVSTCARGFSGWLFWTFDTVEQPELWTLSDANGAINGVLAPTVRPNPCEAPVTGNAPAGNAPACSSFVGQFRSGNGKTIYYSNGSAYCSYVSWSDYLKAGGPPDTTSLKDINPIPACWKYDGGCVVN